MDVSKFQKMYGAKSLVDRYQAIHLFRVNMVIQ